MTNYIEKAISIAVKAHEGQTDKAGKPYILHPLRVMSNFTNEFDIIVAVLHDVIEDTDWTIERLKEEGFHIYILESLKNITRKNNESYESYILRIKEYEIARRVKLADLEDNLDVTRLKVIEEKDIKRLIKYLKAKKELFFNKGLQYEPD